MSVSCKFQLTRSSNIYYTGELIEGSVYLRPLKSRQVEAIYLQFCGQTQVAWWDVDKLANVSKNIVHNDYSTQEVRQKIKFSNRQKHVCDQLKLANRQWLQPHVEYGYQFSFLIPQQVPATSRCPLGECKYVLQLVLQHAKKVNKEFNQKITVKRKLDLSQILENKEPCTVSQKNQFGHVLLSTPCTGFTPGQRIPYLLDLQSTQVNCKILMQLNCYMRCHSTTPSDSEKIIKQIINLQKHNDFGEIMSHLTMPLESHISMPQGEMEEKMILSYKYVLQALVINGSKKILLSVAIPLTIGTIPCINSPLEEIEDEKHSMCFDNYGSPHGIPLANSMNLPTTIYEEQEIFNSIDLIPITPRATHLRRSLRYCYKKLLKNI